MMILRMAKGWRQSWRKDRRQLAFWSNKAQHAEELQSRKVWLSLDIICSHEDGNNERCFVILSLLHVVKLEYFNGCEMERENSKSRGQKQKVYIPLISICLFSGSPPGSRAVENLQKFWFQNTCKNFELSGKVGLVSIAILYSCAQVNNFFQEKPAKIHISIV